VLRSAQSDSSQDDLEDDIDLEDGVGDGDEEGDSEEHEDHDEDEGGLDVSSGAVEDDEDSEIDEIDEEMAREKRDDAKMTRIIRNLLPNADRTQSDLDISREKAFRQANKALYSKICDIALILVAQNATKRDLHEVIINSVSSA